MYKAPIIQPGLIWPLFCVRPPKKVTMISHLLSTSREAEGRQNSMALYGAWCSKENTWSGKKKTSGLEDNSSGCYYKHLEACLCVCVCVCVCMCAFLSNFLCVFKIQFSSVAQSCPTLWDPMNRSMPGLPVHHQLPEFTQTHVHWVGDAIQPSHPLLSPSPTAPNPSQH